MRQSFHVAFFAGVVFFKLYAVVAHAHPGSGIVVDDRGRVFFQDSTGRAIWMVGTDGRLTSTVGQAPPDASHASH